MGSEILGSLLGHWELSLAAAAAGFLIGTSILLVSYLGPLVRLHVASDPAARRRILKGETARLRRLGDAAAVLEEHGRPGAGELRAEAELRALLLQATERTGVGPRSGAAISPPDLP